MGKKDISVKCRFCKSKIDFKDKIEKENWKDNGFKCTSCNKKWCILPNTEIKLFQIQEKFLKNKKEEYAVQLYNILLPYTKSTLLKYFSKVISSPDDLDYFAKNAVSLILEEYYRTDISFQVLRSFGGLINYKIKEVLYGTKTRGKFPKDKDGKFLPIISLNWEFDDGNEVIYSGNKDSIIEFEDKFNRFHLCEYLSNLIFAMDNYCSYENYYPMLVGVNLFLSKGINFANNFFRQYGRKGKETFDKIIDILQNEIKNKVT